MNIGFKQISILFLAMVASLILIEAHAGKPVKVTVTDADPPVAIQGQEELVVIDGTGFDDGSTARFIVTDTRDDTQIDVIEVTLDVTGKLKAKIKVKDAALPVMYDIEVRTSSGRRGKGTSLFRVDEKEDDGTFSAIDITAGFYYDCADQASVCEAMEEADPYPTDTPGWENWFENTLSVIPRPCSGESVSQLGNPATAGRYFCMQEDETGGRISLKLAGTDLVWEDVTPSKKRKYPGFCKLLNVWDDYRSEPVSFGATWYAFVFQDGCTPEYCPIDLVTQSYSGPTNTFGYVELHPFRNLTGLQIDGDGQIRDLPDVGPLGVIMDIDTSFINFPADPEELNVFTMPQNLPVTQIRIEFRKITAPSGAMAVCQAEVDNIWFVTEPQ